MDEEAPRHEPETSDRSRELSAAADPISIPRSLDEITPDWLNDALHSSRVLARGRIVACRVAPTGADFGFASRIGRVELAYEAVEGLPATMIVKLAMATEHADLRRTLVAKHRNEARFYAHVAPGVGLRVPTCYFLANAGDGEAMVLLLEDLGAARFGDAGVGCTLEEAGAVLDALAGMHARWWDSPRLDEFAWLAPLGPIGDGLRNLPDRWDRFLGRFGDLVSPAMRRLAERIGPDDAKLLDTLSGPPHTLLHVDTHLDNIAFVDLDAGVEPVLFDWQGVSRGRSVLDVSIFLSTALRGENRSHERGLLERYHEGLLAGGATNYGRAQLLADYRLAMLRWWLGTVLGYGAAHAASWSGRQLDVARDSLATWAAIIDDLHLAGLVGH